MGRKWAAAAVLAGLLVGAAPASAGTDAMEDPAGDTGGYASSGPSVDIVKSTVAEAKGRRLAITVTLDGAVDANRTPLVMIETGDRVNRWCDFVAGRTDHGLGVFTCEYMDRTGGVRVTASGNTLKYVFSRKAIGLPAHVAWAVVTRGEDSGTAVEYDRAPSEPDTFVAYR
jgi:hypothetical protein